MLKTPALLIVVSLACTLGCNNSDNGVELPADRSAVKNASANSGVAPSEPEAYPIPTVKARTKQSKAPPVNVSFAIPIRLKSGDDFISTESPGYACPTLSDVDGDGKKDLVVGQFRDGMMSYFKNIAEPDRLPKFVEQEWIMTGDEQAQVPGVW